MKLKPMKNIARLALLLLIAISLAFAVFSFVSGWQPTDNYSETIAGEGMRVSTFSMEFSAGALASIVISGAIVLTSGTALAADWLVRKRRTYILKDTIRQCKEYAASILKTGMRNNAFFFL